MNLIPLFLFRAPASPRGFPGREQLLHRSRAALRRGQLDLAECFVMESGDAVWRDPSALNVLGLIAEARGQWSRAKRLWGRSMRADRRYQPPRQNLRRYFELFQYGRSSHPVAFGDEPQFAAKAV